MEIHITARHIRLTQPIRAYVEQKVSKAQKYFNHIVWAQVILSVEKRANQAEVVIHGARHTFRVQASGADLYSAIDLVSDKIDAQLKKYKERIRDRHKGQGSELEAVPVTVPGEMTFSVVKQELKPMSREEAVDEMDELGHNFRLFMDSSSGQMNVVYRREDDSYGLVQPLKRNGK